MWIFLATEILFFGGMFTSYTIYRALHLPAFNTGSHLLEVQFGATNTAVLICSSLTMALAIRAAQTGKSNSTDHLLSDSDHDLWAPLSLASSCGSSGATTTSKALFPALQWRYEWPLRLRACRCSCASIFS